jgi:hypothetical protein
MLECVQHCFSINLNGVLQMTKLFKVGGVSKSKSGYKVRFATDMTRVKILAKTDSDINLMELPTAMDKPALVAFLKTSDLYANAEYRDAIDTADAKYNGVVKAKGAKVKAKPSLEAIKARAEAVAE